MEISRPVQSDWKAHCAYWKSFWERSYIHILSGGEGKFNLDQCRFTQFAQGSKAYEGHKEIDAQQNINQINQRYALERFCQAAASRGAVPPPYNGSIFTMDMPAGVFGFNKTERKTVSPDGRVMAFDFPIGGRAAMMTRSPGWRPRVIVSRSTNPVGTIGIDGRASSTTNCCVTTTSRRVTSHLCTSPLMSTMQSKRCRASTVRITRCDGLAAG